MEKHNNEKGLRYITEKYYCKLWENNDGYEYPYLKNNLYHLYFQGFLKSIIYNFINIRILNLESNLIEKWKIIKFILLYLQKIYI